ncbi:MAG: hypothetical protein S4CHLAM20_02450 [Chlamydiia bacterium]|nr:hypothetical protein [Chlamydiia bacterium]
MIDILRFIFFAVAAMIAPGANNMAAQDSCEKHGYKKTLPHYFGLMFAVSIMLFISAFGFVYFFEDNKSIHVIVANLGTLNVLFFAGQINKKPDTDESEPTEAMRFFKTALHQWVNPEVWLICITLAGMFDYSYSVVLNALELIAVVIAINFPCYMVWLVYGCKIKSMIKTKRQRQWIKMSFAFLLSVCVILLWL